MKLRIPYITTGIETDLALTFCLAPVWWFTGFSIFIYHGLALLVFIKLLVLHVQENKRFQIPRPSIFLFYFLISYLLSILVNVGRIPLQRTFASFNNYSMIVMGYLLVLCIQNSNFEILLDRFMKACRVLCMLTGAMGLIVLLIWSQGTVIKFTAPIGEFFPALMNYPYFYALLSITGTVLDFFSNFDMPRLTLYSGAPTSTGGSMLCMISLMMAYYAFNSQKKVEYLAVLLISLVVLFFSVSRSAIIGFFAAWIFCWVLSRGRPFLTGLFLLVLSLFGSGLFYRLFDWIFNLRVDSNVGRVWLYGEALKILSRENILLGIGGRLREGFTMYAIGSHALYIEIIFVSGLIGLGLFLIFQGVTLLHWYRQKPSADQKGKMILWRYLGMGLISLNLWFFTDTFFALPLIAYGYFMLVGLIYSFDKMEPG